MRPWPAIALLVAGCKLLTAGNAHSAAAAEPTPEESASANVRVITQPGLQFSDSARLWQGIPSIERTKGGRLVVAWYSGGPSEGDTQNYCLLAVSNDNNRTWSPPVLVVQGEEGVRTGEPQPWLDPLGRLWLFWNEIHPDKARRGTWAIRCDAPDAALDAWKWTAPQFIGGGIVLGKPLATRGGAWLAPIDVRNDSPLAAQIGKNRGGVLISTDQGKSWQWHGGWQLPDGVNDFEEHCLAERGDGSLWTVLRVRDGLMQSQSTDGGQTWTSPAPFLTGARTRAHLSRLASGRLLLIYHDGPAHESKTGTSYRREALTAFLSDDDGLTWKKKVLLDARNRVSYPDATEGPAGQIHITYDYARYHTGCKEVLALTIAEADILANRPLPTPTLVNRATGYGNVQEVTSGDEEKLRAEVNKKMLENSPQPSPSGK